MHVPASFAVLPFSGTANSDFKMPRVRNIPRSRALWISLGLGVGHVQWRHNMLPSYTYMGQLIESVDAGRADTWATHGDAFTDVNDAFTYPASRVTMQRHHHALYLIT